MKKVLLFTLAFLFLTSCTHPVPIVATFIHTSTLTRTITPRPSSTKIFIPTFTSTMTLTPTPTDNIPPAKYDYSCLYLIDNLYNPNIHDPPKLECIAKDDSFQSKITHVLFMEGGGENIQLLVDMLQILQNEMYSAWKRPVINPNNVPWAEITPDQFERLALYIVSQPYHVIKQEHPAWNGWEQPLPIGNIHQTQLTTRMLTTVEIAVEAWSANCVGYAPTIKESCIEAEGYYGRFFMPQPGVRNTNVLYIYSTEGHLLKNAPIKAVDAVTFGGRTLYVQFLTLPGVNFNH